MKLLSRGVCQCMFCVNSLIVCLFSLWIASATQFLTSTNSPQLMLPISKTFIRCRSANQQSLVKQASSNLFFFLQCSRRILPCIFTHLHITLNLHFTCILHFILITASICLAIQASISKNHQPFSHLKINQYFILSCKNNYLSVQNGRSLIRNLFGIFDIFQHKLN